VPRLHILSLNDIFLDITGNLEGEGMVGKCIPDRPLSWSRIVLVHPGPEVLLEEVEDLEDWRAPILDQWGSPCIRIHIKTKGH
jgi:hypothetical protein